MNIFENITITHIEPPVVVHSQKGHKNHMTNRNFFGISLCMGGQITYSMNGKQFLSTKDSVILHPKGSSYFLHGDKEGFFPVINFDCENLICNEITVFYPDNINNCLKEFENLKNIYLQGRDRLKLMSSLYKLLSNITSAKSQKHQPLENVVKYIHSNISDANLSNEKLADQIGISEVYFRKLFLSCYGITPKQYILNYRIERAKQLLTDTPNTVTKISEMCGFSSPYHFCRVFKTKAGIPPTQYAKENTVYKI